MRYTLTLESKNVKTGPIPVSMTSAESCPKVCPFNGRGKGCYSATGPISWTWNKLTNGKIGGDFKAFLSGVKSLPKGQIWRHNQSGDASGKNDKINSNHLKSLVAANRGKNGFTYTHYPVINHKFAKENKKAINHANKNGFTINLSGNNLAHADKLKKLNIAPVVCIIPIGSPNTVFTPAGNKVIKCPAQQKEGITCKSCQLCQKVNRSVIIGFEAHGVLKNKVSLIAGN